MGHGKIMFVADLPMRLKYMIQDNIEDLVTVVIYGDTLKAHGAMGLLQENLRCVHVPERLGKEGYDHLQPASDSTLRGGLIRAIPVLE